MAKYRQIFEVLQRQIADGKFAKSRRLPSEVELARRFGVSRPTAARALRDLQSLGILERRVGSGTYLRTSEDAAIDGLTVGFFAPGLGHTEILEPISSEIAAAAQSRQVAVWWADSSTAVTAEQARAVCQRYIDRRLHGVFFAPLENIPHREAANQSIVEMLGDADIPVVLLDRDFTDFPRRSTYDLVGIDNFQAAFSLAEHLVLTASRRHFRFVARPGFPSTTDLRVAGCREALARHGVAVDQDWARFGDPTDAEFVKEVLQPKTDVVVCANDLTAALFMQTLTAMGVRLPDDVAIVGFDDVKYATLLSIPLTTMRQPCRAIGQTALDTLLHRIQHPTSPAREVLLTGELVIRRSCGSAESEAVRRQSH